MHSRTTSTGLPVRFLAVLALGSSALAQQPLGLGGARQLFLDDHLVAANDGVRFELGNLRDEGAAFHCDRSWEGRFSGYSTVLHDGDRSDSRPASVAAVDLGGDGDMDLVSANGDSDDLTILFNGN